VKDGNSSAYVMTYVYSPDERTMVIRLEATPAVRLWANGQLIDESAGSPDGSWWARRVPVTLRRGRNVFLAKVRGSFLLRLGDTPLERAMAFAQQGRWDEAAFLVQQARPELPHDPLAWVGLAHTLAVTGKAEAYVRLCEELVQRYGDTKDVGFGCW